MSHRARIAAAALAVACSVRTASADRDIVIETPGERSAQNKAMLGGLTGAGVLVGGLGLYFHLDSRSASNEVSATQLTGEAWTASHQALVDRASRSRTRAAVAYGIGGALVISAIVALIVTEPATHTEVIRAGAIPTVAPVDGGAVVGGWWTW